MSGSDVKERVLGYANDWLANSPPLKKFLDVLILALATALGLALWSAYSSHSDIVSMVGRFLERYPSINIAKVDAGWDAAWETAKSNGAVGLEVWGVELSDNTRTLIRSETTDPAHAELLKEHSRRPLVSANITEAASMVLADLLVGDSSVGPRWLEDEKAARKLPLIGLFIALPDSPGRHLCGVVVVSFPETISDNRIRVVRQHLIPWTETLTR